MIPFPKKKYQIIYADPPWSYREKNYNQMGKTNASTDHYQTIDTKDIACIPVCEISDDDCLLFMWATSPNLNQAFIVGEAWGFKYITVGFVWDKRITLVGNYTLSQYEQCLIFKKGKIPQPRGARNILQKVDWRKEEHSKKPPEVRDRIHRMFPEQSKIELFARWSGNDIWDVWGDET